jgi:hypothetical protein
MSPDDQGRPPLWKSAAGVLGFGTISVLALGSTVFLVLDLVNAIAYLRGFGAEVRGTEGIEGGREALIPWIASSGAIGSDGMIRGIIVDVLGGMATLILGVAMWALAATALGKARGKTPTGRVASGSRFKPTDV